MRDKPPRDAMLQTIFGLMAGALLLWGCAADMDPHEAGSATNPRKVLVAAQDSVFKRAVLA